MKKVLALVLAFAMMFSTITVAFAEPEVSAEAKALATVGMLEGDGNGVTAEYTAKEMTRFTAAISLLKLKGLYNDALAFKGDANFADVDAVKWEEGKNILAYLKANPGLGFGGNEKGEFNPNGNINEQSYYKVLLETLGYKQTTAEVAGDFAWAEVLEFAEKVGLKPAKAEKFTVDELAKATVGALKAKMKDGKVLINVLVEAGKVDKAKAVAAELMAEKPEVTAALKSAKAIGNTVVEVEFDAEVNAGAEDVAIYSIAGLEVKSAILDGTKKVLLETAAQTAGKTYTLVVGEVKVNFGGKAKAAGAPELSSVAGTDTETVELKFSKVLDYASASDMANYSIANVTIEKIKFNADRNKVTLTTKGLTANKTHTVKVTNIKSVDGVALKSASKSFYAKSDKVAPKIEKVESMTYTRALVKFNEELDKETAENVENYTISGLTIEKAVLVADDSADEVERWVELTTSAQKAGTSYTLKVKGVKDTSVLANEIVKEVSAKFTGKTQDKTGPTVSKTTVLNRNRLLVEFSDASRLDFTTVENVANYEFNKDVTVEKVEMRPGYNNDTKAAILTVSDMAEKTTYKLTITGVTDEYGNEMKKVEKSINYSSTNLNAAQITNVASTSKNKVVITFNKHVDPVTAKDVANYSINGDLGTPIAAKISDDLYKVTLTVNDQVEGKSYKVTVNGVMDLAGNTLKTSSSFVGLTTENDIEPPEIEDITVVNQRVMRITFSEAIKVKDVAGIKARLNDGDLDLKATYEGNTVLEFSRGTNFKDVEYTLKSFVNVRDKAGNDVNQTIDKDGITFWGDNSVAENIDFSWEQINVAKYKLTFSEKVEPTSGAVNKTNYSDDDKDDLGMDTVWYLTKKVAIDKDAFKGNINKEFASRHVNVLINNTEEEKANETKITASIDDTDAPYIEDVIAEYRDKIKVVFNEDIKTYGVYEISYYDLAGKLKKVSGITGTADPDNDNIAILYVDGKIALESRFDYTLKVTTQVQDLAGNKTEKDLTYDFQGTDLVAAGNYITGVEIINGTTFNVRLNKAIKGNVDGKANATPPTAVTPATLKLGTANIDVTTANNMTGTAEKSNKFTVTLTNDVLQNGKNYEVTIGGMSYKFDGTVESSLSVEQDGQKLVITYSDLKANDVVTICYGQVDKTAKTVSVGNVNVSPGTDQVDYTLAANKVLFNVVVKRGVVTLYTYENDEENQNAADVVSGLIEGIKTAGDRDAARAQYNKLTVIQKSLVSNYGTLLDAESLQDAIDDAQALHDDATEGTASGNYAIGSKATLQAAINAAQLVYNNATSTLADLENAKITLANAVAAFEAKLVP